MSFPSRMSDQAYTPTSMNIVAPTQTSVCVRSPASCSRSSRSTPIAPASSAASPRRRSPSQRERSGAAACTHGLLLRDHDLLDPAPGEVEHPVQLLAREGLALRRRLHLDQAPVG